MNDFFKEIRESCTSETWSNAVQLVRSAQFAARENQGVITINVLTGDPVQPVVTLHPADFDWQCTCSSKEDPCQHVAACVIAIRRATERGEKLPQASNENAKVVYRFEEINDGLHLFRMLSVKGSEEPLLSTLTAITTGRIKGPPIILSPGDLEIDRIVGLEPLLPLKQAGEILALLSQLNEVITLGTIKVTCSTQPIGLLITVIDDGPGISASASQNRKITKIFKNGFALCGTSVHALSVPTTTPEIQTIIKSGRFYGRQDFAYFSGTVLPEIRDKFDVRITSKQLPDFTWTSAKLEIHIEDKYPNGVNVTPSIVYGDPVIMRITDGRVHNYDNQVSNRDAAAELRLKDELYRQTGLELGPPVFLPTEAALNFVVKMGRFRGDVTGDGYSRWSIMGDLEFDPANFESSSSFGFTIKNQSGRSDSKKDSGAALASVLKAWKKGESYVRLEHGGFGKIPVKWLESNHEQLSWISTNKDAIKSNTLGKAAGINFCQVIEHLGGTPPTSLAKMKNNFAELLDSAKNKTPSTAHKKLNATLRPYQIEGINWLQMLKESGQGGILADDMGLGKTIQTIAVLGKPSLVIAPTSVIRNWEREIKKFRADLKVNVYHGNSRSVDTDADVTITSYNLLRIDAQNFKQQWDTVVADEAQMIKNPESQIFAAVCSLDAKTRYALTGTPIENRLTDLWSQMSFVNPGLLGDRKYFTEQFANPIQQQKIEILNLLKLRLRPYFLRRLKTEVATDLPPRTSIMKSIEMSVEEQKLYDSVLNSARKEVSDSLNEDSKPKNVLHILELLLRLRQACCHPDLLPGISGKTSSKVTELIESLDVLTSEGHQVLVFSQWTSLLDLIAIELNKNSMNSLRIDGSTVDRQGVVDKFQSGKAAKILLMSLKAGGTGLNLTAADHVIIMDPWWNPATEDQAAGRVWRIGQDKPVVVHKYVAANTIEESIVKLQESKQHLSDMVTGGDFANALTINDVMELLAL